MLRARGNSGACDHKEPACVKTVIVKWTSQLLGRWRGFEGRREIYGQRLGSALPMWYGLCKTKNVPG